MGFILKIQNYPKILKFPKILILKKIIMGHFDHAIGINTGSPNYYNNKWTPKKY